MIVCTDHGHYLGDVREDRDIWGKPLVPQYEPLGHIPLLVHWPGRSGGGTIDAAHDERRPPRDVVRHLRRRQRAAIPHGVSLVPLLTGQSTSVREWALSGVYGKWVQVADGRRKYARAPEGDGFPMAMWSNRWSTMPLPAGIPFDPLPMPDDRATLECMPGSTVPVIRQPFAAGDPVPLIAAQVDRIVGRHHLYDLALDPDETENRARRSERGADGRGVDRGTPFGRSAAGTIRGLGLPNT